MFEKNVRAIAILFDSCGTLVGQVYNRAQKRLGAQR